jgi:hypothetical protein
MGSLGSVCGESGSSTPDYAQILAALPNILKNIPEEWNGTTFKNKELFNQDRWEPRFLNLVGEKGTKITK